jgi:hypothetical protein
VSEFEQVPEHCRQGYARLVSELVRFFSVDKLSGKAIVNIKEGCPMEVEPSPRIRLDK